MPEAQHESAVLEREGVKELSEITIVMAAYNGEAYVKEQISSILTGGFQDFVIHVYDDGSTDRTRDILRELASEHPDKLCFFANEKNKGVIRNFMEGANQADSPYVMFCDQDDIWLSDKISRTLLKMKEMEARKGKKVPLAVFTDARVVDEKLQELHPSFHGSSRLDAEKTDLCHLLMENKLIGCTMMINAAMAKKLSFVPEGVRMHDWWIGLIAAALGEIAYLPEATLLYRQHEKNVVGTKSFVSYVRNRLLTLSRQRLALRQNEEQAQALLDGFGSELSEEASAVLTAFAAMKTAGFFKKRYLLIKYGFWKTGWIRNAGVFLLI